MGYPNLRIAIRGGYLMDNNSTHEFVEKVHDTQEKARKNQQRFGKGTPGDKLPGKQHSTNK